MKYKIQVRNYFTNHRWPTYPFRDKWVYKKFIIAIIVVSPLNVFAFKMMFVMHVDMYDIHII